MSLLGNIGRLAGGVISAPFKAVAAVAKAVTPAATELLRSVMNTGFDVAKLGLNVFQSLGPLAFLANPMLALAAPLLGQGLQALQNGGNQALTSFNSMVQGRPMPMPQYPGMQQFPGQFYPPSFDQRMMNPYGFAGQYGSQQIGAQIAQAAATAGFGGGSGAAVAAGAGFLPTGINPAGNSNADLVNTIANAPLFSPDEAQLMSKLPPEQQAMMTLQAKKQRESLMTSVLTNIANMKHESLKGIAQNLRG